MSGHWSGWSLPSFFASTLLLYLELKAFVFKHSLGVVLFMSKFCIKFLFNELLLSYCPLYFIMQRPDMDVAVVGFYCNHKLISHKVTLLNIVSFLWSVATASIVIWWEQRKQRKIKNKILKLSLYSQIYNVISEIYRGLYLGKLGSTSLKFSLLELVL